MTWEINLHNNILGDDNVIKCYVFYSNDMIDNIIDVEILFEAVNRNVSRRHNLDRDSI